MNKAIERVFELLHQLRDAHTEYVISVSDNLDGFIQGIFWAGVITSDQYKALAALAANAYCKSGDPFPSMLNAGPCISWWELHKRTVATHLLEKPQAQVQANEKPESVSAPAPRRELRLLCLLGRHGSIIPSSPALTMRAMPPRVDKLASWSRWSSSSVPGLYLRETYAVAPSAQVLARLQRHGQAHAIRATARTVQFGVTA